MKKVLLIALVLALMAVVTSSTLLAQDEPLRITYVVNGVLGDKSFFDSGQRGMDMVMDEYDAEVNTIELGIDPANWETGLLDAMSDVDSYDILITGTFQMIDYLAAHAHEYPDKTFIFFDAPMPYDNPEICVEGCTNVYSITYKQNEGSFLAGIYAAAMSRVGALGEEFAGAAPVLGAVGGQDIPVINDFIVGYEQGACLVDPESTVLVQYAGGWNDPARGKEIALAMYQQGASIVFQIAGGTGVGVFEAAAEQSRYAIGVDSDQATIILDTDPEQAARILTSMMKNVDLSLFRAITLYLDGELPVGTVEGLGIAEMGVGLAVNDIYREATPQSVQDLIAAVEEAVIAGEITVNTVFAPEGEAATVGMGCANMPEVTFDVSAFLSSR
ncbi:MAG: BMP family ABC transporter substrate-binding protein [Candidatus Flexifilum sp.]|jgi:basic membrane protein A